MRNVWLLLVLSACGDGHQREGACRFVDDAGVQTCRQSVMREEWLRSLPPTVHADLDGECRRNGGAVVMECMPNTAPGACVFRLVDRTNSDRYETTLAAARMRCARLSGMWIDDPR